MAGRRPKPTLLKLVTGNPGKRPLPESEPTPPDGEIVRPRFLKYRAKELWEDRAPIYIAMGTLTLADVDHFAAWCVLMAKFENLKGEMLSSQVAQMRMLGADFGMGASARAKLGTTGKGKPKDPADEFFGSSGKTG